MRNSLFESETNFPHVQNSLFKSETGLAHVQNSLFKSETGSRPHGMPIFKNKANFSDRQGPWPMGAVQGFLGMIYGALRLTRKALHAVFYSEA